MAALADEIVAITWSHNTLIAATRDALLWRAPGGDWQTDGVARAHLGDMTALGPDSAGVWVAGDRGIALFRFEPRDYVVFNTPGDFPGSIRDLVGDDTYLWIATEGGLVRLTRAHVMP